MTVSAAWHRVGGSQADRCRLTTAALPQAAPTTLVQMWTEVTENAVDLGPSQPICVTVSGHLDTASLSESLGPHQRRSFSFCQTAGFIS